MYVQCGLFAIGFLSDPRNEYATRARRLGIEPQRVLQRALHCWTRACKCNRHHFCFGFLFDTCQINVFALIRVLTRASNHVTTSSFCAVEKLHVE